MDSPATSSQMLHSDDDISSLASVNERLRRFIADFPDMQYSDATFLPPPFGSMQSVLAPQSNRARSMSGPRGDRPSIRPVYDLPATPPPAFRRVTRSLRNRSSLEDLSPPPDLRARFTRTTRSPTDALARRVTRASRDHPAAERFLKKRSAESPSMEPPRKRVCQASLKKPPANLKRDEDYDDDVKASPSCTVSCCICMCEPETAELSTVDGCTHSFCFTCICKWADRENTCPLCKSRFGKITRVHKRKGMVSTKTVKARDQRCDLFSGAAFEGFMAGVAAQHGAGGGFLRSFILARMGSSMRAPAARDTPVPSHGYRFTLEDPFVDNGNDEGGDSPLAFDFFLRAPHPPAAAASRVNGQGSASHPLLIDSDDDEVEIVEIRRRA
jgi:hypothetical protein